MLDLGSCGVTAERVRFAALQQAGSALWLLERPTVATPCHEAAQPATGAVMAQQERGAGSSIGGREHSMAPMGPPHIRWLGDHQRRLMPRSIRFKRHRVHGVCHLHLQRGVGGRCASCDWSLH